MVCPSCNNNIPESSSFCTNCGRAVSIYSPPEGYTLDINSGLYFHSVEGNDLNTGKYGKWVTWFYPNSGEYKQVFVPDSDMADPMTEMHSYHDQTVALDASAHGAYPETSDAYASLTANAAWSEQALSAKKSLSPLMFVIPAVALLLVGAFIALVYFGVLFGDNDIDQESPGDIDNVQNQGALSDPGGNSDGQGDAPGDGGILTPLPEMPIYFDDGVFAQYDAIPRLVEANSIVFSDQLLDAVNSGNMYHGFQVPAWAEKDIGTADYLALIPGMAMGHFEEPVLRGDYAALVYQFLLRLTGMTESQLHNAVHMLYFYDSDDPAVAICAGLGILNGYEDGTFRPYDPVTRQTAAVILSRLAAVVGLQSSGHNIDFIDISGLWSEEDIRFMSALFDPYTGNTVMGGTGDNRFSPDEGFTRLQAIITMLRLAGATTDFYLSQLGGGGLYHTEPNLLQIEGVTASNNSEGMFVTYMNIDWSFPGGGAPSSNAIMGNSPNNIYPFRFEVVLMNTDEIVLATDIIPVGMQMAEIRLDRNLQAGEYPASVNVHFINDYGIPQGEVRIAINLTIG